MKDSTVLRIFSKYKDGDIISQKDASKFIKYCFELEHQCQKCALHKQVGKCPIHIKLA